MTDKKKLKIADEETKKAIQLSEKLSDLIAKEINGSPMELAVPTSMIALSTCLAGVVISLIENGLKYENDIIDDVARHAKHLIKALKDIHPVFCKH